MNPRFTLFVAIYIAMHRANTMAEVALFVRPGFAACYVASTQYETVNGAAKLCPHSVLTRSICAGAGLEYYFYCSEDHDCCYQDGCPACCTSRTTLNTAEIACVVISCVVLAAIILCVAYFVAGRACSKKNDYWSLPRQSLLNTETLP